MPTTSQNQARIEDDARRSPETLGLDTPEAELHADGETVTRNHDPCIACATHFLDLRVQC